MHEDISLRKHPSASHGKQPTRAARGRSLSPCGNGPLRGGSSGLQADPRRRNVGMRTEPSLGHGPKRYVVAAPRAYMVSELLARPEYELNLLDVPSRRAALEAVLRGDADATVSLLPNASFHITNEGWTSLKLAGVAAGSNVHRAPVQRQHGRTSSVGRRSPSRPPCPSRPQRRARRVTLRPLGIEASAAPSPTK